MISYPRAGIRKRCVADLRGQGVSCVMCVFALSGTDFRNAFRDFPSRTSAADLNALYYVICLFVAYLFNIHILTRDLVIYSA